MDSVEELTGELTKLKKHGDKRLVEVLLALSLCDDGQEKEDVTSAITDLGYVTYATTVDSTRIALHLFQGSVHIGGTNSEREIEQAGKILWQAGVPHTWWLSMGMYLNVPRSHLERALEALREHPKLAERILKEEYRSKR